MFRRTFFTDVVKAVTYSRAGDVSVCVLICNESEWGAEEERGLLCSACSVQAGKLGRWHFSVKSLLWRDSSSAFAHAFFFFLTRRPKPLCLSPLDWEVWCSVHIHLLTVKTATLLFFFFPARPSRSSNAVAKALLSFWRPSDRNTATIPLPHHCQHYRSITPSFWVQNHFGYCIRISPQSEVQV